MASRRGDHFDHRPSRGFRPRRVARFAEVLGLAVVALALPAAVIAGWRLLSGVPSLGLAVDRLSVALWSPLSALSGPAALFHGVAVVLFVGTWLLGFGLIVDGYLD